MGNCTTFSVSAGDAASIEEIEKNKNIALLSQDEYNKQNSVINILVLGAGESGKSTIFRQMTKLYGRGYSENELMEYFFIFQQNLIESFQGLQTIVDELQQDGLPEYFDKAKMADCYIFSESEAMDWFVSSCSDIFRNQLTYASSNQKNSESKENEEKKPGESEANEDIQTIALDELDGDLVHYLCDLEKLEQEGLDAYQAYAEENSDNPENNDDKIQTSEAENADQNSSPEKESSKSTNPEKNDEPSSNLNKDNNTNKDNNDKDNKDKDNNIENKTSQFGFLCKLLGEPSLESRLLSTLQNHISSFISSFNSSYEPSSSEKAKKDDSEKTKLKKMKESFISSLDLEKIFPASLLSELNTQRESIISSYLSASASDLLCIPADLQLALDENEEISIETLASLRRLWETPAMRTAFSLRQMKVSIQDNIRYFLVRYPTVRSALDIWCPSVADVIRSRIRTTGIQTREIFMQGNRLQLIDVGGQRSERRKWVNLLDDVTAVIYVASAAGYNQVLFEDETVNRLREDVQLFEQICNIRVFENAAQVLFLNKQDLFEEKIDVIPLSQTFPEFISYMENIWAGNEDKNAELVKKGGDKKEDDDDEEEKSDKEIEEEKERKKEFEEKFKKLSREDRIRFSKEFIKALFEAKNKSGKSLYTHFTSATDTTNIIKIFNSVKAFVIKGSLSVGGLI